MPERDLEECPTCGGLTRGDCPDCTPKGPQKITEEVWKSTLEPGSKVLLLQEASRHLGHAILALKAAEWTTTMTWAQELQDRVEEGLKLIG